MNKRSSDWWESPEVSEAEIFKIINFYMDCASVSGHTFYSSNFKNISKNKMSAWNIDALNLTRLIRSVKAQPREFITAQFVLYKKPTPKARPFPTMKMMTTPSAVERWRQYLVNIGKILPVAQAVSKEEMYQFNLDRMRHLMEQYKIEREEDFFKDPVLISQLSKSFAENFSAFNKLVEDNFYKKNFGLEVQNLFA